MVTAAAGCQPSTTQELICPTKPSKARKLVATQALVMPKHCHPHFPLQVLYQMQRHLNGGFHRA